jgi:hypothetical protein
VAFFAVAEIVWKPAVGCRLRSMEYPVSPGAVFVSGHDRKIWLVERAVAVSVVEASVLTVSGAIDPLGARQTSGPPSLQSLASSLRH